MLSPEDQALWESLQAAGNPEFDQQGAARQLRDRASARRTQQRMNAGPMAALQLFGNPAIDESFSPFSEYSRLQQEANPKKSFRMNVASLGQGPNREGLVNDKGAGIASDPAFWLQDSGPFSPTLESLPPSILALLRK
jgi:hypothetical protein